MKYHRAGKHTPNLMLTLGSRSLGAQQSESILRASANHGPVSR